MLLSQKMYKCFRPLWAALTCAALASPVVAAAAHPHPHVISYGNRMTVKLFLGPEEDASTTIHVRSLMVDGKMREFVTGEAHEVTERLFVVRRAFRLNNNLPQDEGKVPSWVWERGGWLLVDRLTGHVSQVALVEFDPCLLYTSSYLLPGSRLAGCCLCCDCCVCCWCFCSTCCLVAPAVFCLFRFTCSWSCFSQTPSRTETVEAEAFLSSVSIVWAK